jgi:hypothetical protein
MWIDTLLEFSDAQAVTTTADSTNVIDLSSDRDVGPGQPLYLVVQVDVALDDASANETYVVELETDDNAAMTSSTILNTMTFTRGDVAGTRQWQAIGDNNEQFLQVVYTTGGTTPSGTFSAWLTKEQPESWASYPDAAN